MLPQLGGLQRLRDGEYAAHPFAVRFTHDSISSKFRSGGKVDDIIRQSLEGEWAPKFFPPVDAVILDDKLWALCGNRRLFVFRVLACFDLVDKVTIKLHSFDDDLVQHKRFDERLGRSASKWDRCYSTTTEGRIVRVSSDYAECQVSLEEAYYRSSSEAKSRVTTLGLLATPSDENAIFALVAHVKDECFLFRKDALAALNRLAGKGSSIAIDAARFCLQDESPDVLREAVYLLRNLADDFEVFVPAIIQRLSDVHPRVRKAAARALTGRTSAQVLDALTALLTDVSSSVRLAALHALPGHRHNFVHPALLSCIKDKKMTISVAALTYLRDNAALLRGDKDAVSAVMSLLQPGRVASRLCTMGSSSTPSDTQLLSCALGALSRVAEKDDASVLQAFVMHFEYPNLEVSGSAFVNLDGFVSKDNLDAISALVSHLQTCQNVDIVAKAFAVLSKLVSGANADATSIAARLLCHEWDVIWMATSLLLGLAIHDHSAHTVLVRKAVLLTRTCLRDVTMVNLVNSCLCDDDTCIQEAALASVKIRATMDDTFDLDFVVPKLTDSCYVVRRAAIQTLRSVYHHHIASSIQLVISRATHENPNIREVAVVALGCIKNKRFFEPVARNAKVAGRHWSALIAVISRCLIRDIPRLRVVAAIALRNLYYGHQSTWRVPSSRGCRERASRDELLSVLTPSGFFDVFIKVVSSSKRQDVPAAEEDSEYNVFLQRALQFSTNLDRASERLYSSYLRS